MKILTVVGARPQFIKAAMVSRALRSLPDVQNITLHTGQHYDSEMSQVFFTELGIPDPDYNLAIGSGTHGRQTGRMLEAIEAVLSREQPDWVVVFGDTNSTLAGALAAAKLHMPLAHVEAGLRSFNRRMPEEINRILTDHASDLLFAPTTLARENLSREGIGSDKARLVGDVMYDAALCYGKLAEEHSTVLARLNLKSKGYILATVHRAENTNDPDRLGAILTDLNGLETEMPVIFPVHPRTRQVLQRNGFVGAGETIRIIEPLGYLDMTMLERHARIIVTDSGGVQKEAFFFSVPCVTLRAETEWRELVEMGWNRLAPPAERHSILVAVQDALLESPTETRNPYGDGRAAEAIVQHLVEWVSTRRQKHSLLSSAL